MISTEKNLKVAYLYDFYGDILSGKQQLAVELYYNDDLSLSEVAQQLGISRQGVRDSLKRSETVLFDLENKLGLAERFGNMLGEIETIKRNALEIEKLSPDNSPILSCAREITLCAEELKKSF